MSVGTASAAPLRRLRWLALLRRHLRLRALLVCQRGRARVRCLAALRPAASPQRRHLRRLRSPRGRVTQPSSRSWSPWGLGPIWIAALGLGLRRTAGARPAGLSSAAEPAILPMTRAARLVAAAGVLLAETRGRMRLLGRSGVLPLSRSPALRRAYSWGSGFSLARRFFLVV